MTPSIPRFITVYNREQIKITKLFSILIITNPLHKRGLPEGYFLLTTLLPVSVFSTDLATSVVPGWHTTVYPPYFLMNIVVSLFLLLTTIAYRKLLRRNVSVSTRVFLTHLGLTIPVVFYITSPCPLEGFMEALIEKLNPESIFDLAIVFLFPYILFLIGQLFFIGYFFKQRSVRKFMDKA